MAEEAEQWKRNPREKITGAVNMEGPGDGRPRPLRSKESQTTNERNTGIPGDAIAADDRATGRPSASPAPRQKALTSPRRQEK